ncbi:ExeA family protein [Lacisediminimonas profundi]|uniref:ExeA family protein n=1 Tax=Lacisediminimonas profundi TaxID=2603856 RepID=UPI00124BA1D8|nr:AAA family ATPase [Lacisediminimonas profundi]
MYTSHFNLREVPFSLTPDTSFFFASSTYQEALNTLVVAVRGGEGFIKITGEVGTGKTMLCRKFISSLDEHFVTAYIPNPSLEPRTLFLTLAEELELNVDKDASQHEVLKAINGALLEKAGQGKQVVLCLDEAQAMPLETLEVLRLLTNLETEKRKLLQIVLFGQPELDRNLRNESVRQLYQRITFHYHLEPLSREDIDFYVAHRLAVAGYAGGRLFTSGAIRALTAGSGGIPRLVNILAHKSLMLAYGKSQRKVSAADVRAAAADTGAARKMSLPWAAVAASVVVVVAVTAGWMVLG